MFTSFYYRTQSLHSNFGFDKMERKRIIAILAVIIVVIAGIAAAAVATSSDDDDRPTLVVETSPDFAPFDYFYGDRYAGIDMDIIRAVCDEIGYKVQFRQNSFDSIIMSVQQHKCDMGASGFTISDERKLSVDFSDTYAEVKQVAVVLKTSSIDSVDDIAGKKLTVQTSTTGADYAETKSSNVIFQKDYQSVVLDVINGNADAEIVDNMVAQGQVAAHPELEIRDILTDAEVEYYGFVFAKDNTSLYNVFNDALVKLKEDGTVEKIINYYVENNCSPETPPYDFSKRSVTVETSPDFPPYEYTLGTEYVGIDMDIMRAIGKDLNWNINFRTNDFNSIIMSVQQGKCDMGASGFTISEERKQQVAFSDPYATVKQVVVVLKSSSINSLDDVRGKTISVQAGTTGADYAATVTDTSKINYQARYTEVVLDVLNGKTDCEIVDDAVARAQVAAHSNLEIRDILTDAETEYYGFVFSKSNTELLEAVNASLARLEENGTLGKIVQYYADHNYDSETPSYYNQDSGSSSDDDDSLWGHFKKDFLDHDRYNYVFTGLKNTIEITVLALIMGMILGALVAMVRSTHDQTGRFRILNAICRIYVTVIRGTPVMVQLLIIYYVVFASVNMNQILIASVAFGINSGAYVAEVFRSGINAVPKGQMEACRSLGMNNSQAMRKVIMPQALRNILPALGNEGISLLKETSVAGYIGVMDLTRAVDIIRGQTYDALIPLLVAAAIYLAIVLVLAYLIKRLERRLNSAY